MEIDVKSANSWGFFSVAKEIMVINTYAASQLQRKTCSVTDSLHLWATRCEFGGGGSQSGIDFFHAYMINQKEF